MTESLLARLAALPPEQRALLEKQLRKKMGEETRGAIPVFPRHQEEYRLSYTQFRMWWLDQIESENPAYIIPIALRIRGSLNLTFLERGLNESIKRHEALRTTFSASEGQPYQQIHPELTIPLHFTDLTVLPEAEREFEAQRLARQEFRRPFHLDELPLIRSTLLRVNEQEYLWLIAVHHIIFDGWSVGVLLQELTSRYQAYGQGDAKPLPPLAVQVVDFAEWEQKQSGDEKLQKQLIYWKEQLQGPLPVLELPIDHPRPQARTSNGKQVNLVLPNGLHRQLQELAREEGVTLFAILMAAYQALLFRYSGQEDLIVGFPVSGRNQTETHPLIGAFVNTLPLRTQLSAEMSFRDLLQQVKARSIEAFANQDVPFERLVEEIQSERRSSYNPLLQTMFNLIKSVPSVELKELSFDYELIDHHTSKFDLMLEVRVGEDGYFNQFLCTFEYNTDLFAEETVHRIAEQFQLVLAGIVHDPSQSLETIDMLTAREFETISAMNATERPYDLQRTALEAFIEQAEQHPQRVALRCGERQITYGELHERSNQMAHFLRAQGVQPNQFVAVLMERGIDVIVSIYGVLKSGAAYLPIDPEYPQERISYMLQDSAAASVLTTRAHMADLAHAVEHLPSVRTVLAVDEETTWSEQPSTNLQNVNRSSDLMYMIYTSGSTGEPKGTMIYHSASVNLMNWLQEEYVLTAQDVVSQTISICFDVSTWEIFWPLRVGAEIVVIPPDDLKDQRQLYRLLVAHGVTVTTFVPSLFTAFVHELTGMNEKKPLERLRYVMTAGEALPIKTVNLWYDLFEKQATIINLYGPTEATVIVTAMRVEGKQQRSIPIGRPTGNSQIHILDRLGRQCPIGVAGELYIGGVQLALGYRNKPEKTAEAFVANHLPHARGERLYRTGDLARIRPDGVIEYVGRIDNQVKVRGFRIELGEIEEALSLHEDIDEAAVIVREHQGDKVIMAYYTSRHEALTVSALRSYLQKKLPEYMTPSYFHRLDRMPLGSSGKIARKMLPMFDLSERPELLSEYVAPVTETERRIADLWSDILHVQQVGREDNFFELGGHSLMVTQMISRLRTSVQVPLTVKSFFEHPSVREFAAYLDHAHQQDDSPFPPIVRLPKQEAYELSHAQKRLWYLHKFDPASTTYSMSGSLIMRGDVEVTAFQAAFRQLVARHETLRTVIVEENEQPWQVVREEADATIPFVDLTAHPAATRERLLTEQTKADRQMPFDLATGPLLRASMYKLDEQEYRLYLNMHHIISDGWSLGVFVRELTDLYAACQQGAVSEFAPQEIRYVDYAAWQNKLLQSGQLEHEEAYWLEKLQKPLPVLQWPTDLPRPSVMTNKGRSLHWHIPSTLYEQVVRLAKEREATPYMVLLSAYFVMLQRLSQDQDLIVGTAVAGRTDHALESLIGCFVNLLAVRVNFAGVHTFDDLLKQVKTASLEALEYQAYPFDLLIEKVKPVRDLSRTPIFSTVFILQNAPLDLSAPNLQLKMVQDDGGTSKYDLTVEAVESSAGLTLRLEYATDLFVEDTIVRLAEQFEQILRRVTQKEAPLLQDIDLLTASSQKVLVQMNETEREYELNQLLLDEFVRQAEAHPDRTALVCADRQMTYGELHQRSNQLAHFLRKQGVRPNDLVAVLIERDIEAIIGIYGILKAGAAYVPIDPEYPQPRIEYMLQDSQVKIVVVNARSFPILQGFQETLPSMQTAIVLNDESEWNSSGYIRAYGWSAVAKEPNTTPERVNNVEDLAYMIYTSGSTGQPKGTMIPHVAIVNFMTWMQETFRIGEEDVVSQTISICFDVSTWELFWPLRSGAQLVILPADDVKDTERLYKQFVKHQVSVTTFVPSLFSNFVFGLEGMSETLRLERLRYVLTIGEMLPIKPVNLWFTLLENAAPIANLYGPTEATVAVSLYMVQAKQTRNIPIGKPIANTQIYIMDEQGRPCPVGVVGELCIGGIQLARGYHNKAEKTAEVFVNRPVNGVPGQRFYRTGDLARVLSDGNLEILGRIDNQVKLRGYRIELGEVEEVLAQHPDVKAAAVIVRKQADDQVMLAFYTPRQEGVTAGELRSYLLKKLPEYMIPAQFHRLERMPLNPTGKIDRKALPEVKLAARPELLTDYLVPETETERQLAAIWANLLKVEQIGRADNFFELGGHSLLVTQVVSRVKKQMQAPVTLRDFFENPTVHQFAALLDQRLSSGAKEQILEIPKAPQQELYELSNSQKRLYFTYKLDPENISYNMPGTLHLRGAFDRQAFEQAFHLLIERHDSLRTIFVEDKGVPMQSISRAVSFTLPVVDLSVYPPDKREAMMRRQIEADQAIPFRLEAAPPIRATIFALNEQEHCFYLNMHHIITDGWSLGVLAREICQLYAQLSQAKQPRLPELELQYTDYAVWQHEQLTSGAWQEAEDYWLDTLASPLPVLELPYDGVRPSDRNLLGDVVHFRLDASLLEKIKQFATEQDASLFMVLFAGYSHLLHYLSQQQDVIIGVPIAGRVQEALEPLIGFFINNLAIRVQFNPQMTALELLQQTKQQTLDAFQHQLYPFDALVEKINPARQINRTPIFSTMFNLQNAPFELQLPELEVKLEQVSTEATKFDMRVFVQEAGGELVGQWEYATDLFERQTIERMVEQYERILQQYVEDATAMLDDADIRTEEDNQLADLLGLFDSLE